MRFFLADGPPPLLDDLANVVRSADAAGLIARDAAEPARGDLYYGDVLYAELEVNRPGDEIFEEDCADLLDELNKQDDPRAELAATALRSSTGAVVMRVYEPGHDDYPRLNVLIDWLFAHRAGVLQVDEEGFFDRDRKRIVALL